MKSSNKPNNPAKAATKSGNKVCVLERLKIKVMTANVLYNDFIGTVAADISDLIAVKFGGNLESIGKYFEIDDKRFSVIGISIDGTAEFTLSLICVDKVKTSFEKEHIVSMSIPIGNEPEFLDLIFKRLNIVLHSRFDNKFPSMQYDEEIEY